MFMDAPETLLYVAGGAFLLGWFVGKIGAYFGNRFQAKKRDPRDDRIRNLEAELRIAQSAAEKSNLETDQLRKELAEEKERVEKRDGIISDQKQKMERLQADLKDSVKKTAELRSELTERAAESVRSEVKLREVETELSVAQASTDLIATGVLDYSMAPDAEVADDGATAKDKKLKSAN